MRAMWTITRPIAVLVAFLVSIPVFAADPSDPFDRANKLRPKVSAASRKLGDLIDFKVEVAPPKAKPGEVVQVKITGTPKSGYYTYPATKLTSSQSKSSVSRIEVKGPSDLSPLHPLKESEPEFVVTPLHEVYLEHKKPFTWTQDVLVSPDAVAGPKEIDVLVRLQVCDKNVCVGPDVYPTLEATVEVLDAPAVSLSKEIQARLEAKEPAVTVVSPPAELVAQAKKQAEDSQKPGAPGVKGSNPGTAAPGQTLNQDLWGLLGAAFFGAFLMLLTPCVFPMIPITVNFFLKQSEKEHYNPMLMASVYSGTIVVMLMMAMFVLGSVVIAWANNAWFNLVFGFILIVFALSLFGMFELELPHFLARFTSSREGQGGLVGAIFMAMTFTITSFTCTGPFLGLMLAPVAGIRPPMIHLVLAALVYSATFAAPFFFLALFPKLLRSLPKSGGWLNTVKVTMGFLEVGAALKFLSIADYELFPGEPRIFTFDAVLCGWIALAFACGLYLFGLFRLPHDDAVEHVGAMRMIVGTIFVGLGFYLLPALFGGKPTGVLGEQILAFAPPQLEQNGALAGARGEALSWTKSYETAWKDAVQNKKLIFMDFTGQNCQNCRYNEKNIFTRPEVVEELKKYALVQLYTDTIPVRGLSYEENKKLTKRYEEWREKMTESVANPTYVILDPDRSIPFDSQGNPAGNMHGFQFGQIFDVQEFISFLRKPLEAQVASR